MLNFLSTLIVYPREISLFTRMTQDKWGRTARLEAGIFVLDKICKAWIHQFPNSLIWEFPHGRSRGMLSTIDYVGEVGRTFRILHEAALTSVRFSSVSDDVQYNHAVWTILSQCSRS
jgi:hypothetical protein